jgi:hypothetical protein
LGLGVRFCHVVLLLLLLLRLLLLLLLLLRWLLSLRVLAGVVLLLKLWGVGSRI